MKNANRNDVYKSVEKCLRQIYQDFYSGRIVENYKIYIPLLRESGNTFIEDMPIKKPKVVYGLILNDGLEVVVESFTENIMKGINCRM